MIRVAGWFWVEVLRSYSEGAISKECSATVVPSSEDFALEDFS